METIKISGFSTGAYGNLGDEIILLSADGDVVLHAGDTVVVEAAEQCVQRTCPYCRQNHDLRLACPEYQDFQIWRKRAIR